MDKSLRKKLLRLRKKIRKLDSAIVAFSGGVDSSLLMRICREELGEKAVAVTATSESYPKAELVLARRIAKVIGTKHVTCRMEDGDDGPYSYLKELAMKMRIRNILDGSHRDDEVDRGATYLAAKDAGVKSPLLESELTKGEIRRLSKELGLPNWDKKSSGSKKPSLEKAAKYLERIGLKKATVARKGKSLQISSHKADLMRALKMMDKIRKKARSLGFQDVLLRLS